jgi:ribosomal-protein-alanine N-acetyltransferase
MGLWGVRPAASSVWCQKVLALQPITSLFDFRVFPRLETRRLVLRQLLPTDAEAIFRVRGDPEVTRYNGGAPLQSVAQAATLIDEIARDFDDRRSIRWGIALPGDEEVIGMVGYNYWVRQDNRASIGYDLARAYWGQGIMPEAVRAILHFGFEHMALNRIEADTDVANVASQRVLEKVGFRRDGVQREQVFERGGYYDLVLFSILRRDMFE